MTYKLIDEPTPFDSAERWRKYLAELRAIEPVTPEVSDAIARAVEHLKALR